MNNDLKSWDVGAKEYLSKTSDDSDPFKKIVDTPSFISLLGNIKNKKVLDIGCGDGIFCKKLSELGAVVTGLDGSQNMLNETKKNFPKINFILCDLMTDKIPVDDNSFDIVTSKMMLMNVKSIKIVSKKVFNVLKESGLYGVDTLHPSYPFIKNLMNADSRYQEELTYFDEIPGNVDFSGVKFTFYYRPLSMYINEILDSGFKLIKVQEPKPSKEFVKKYSNHSFREKYPTSLHMLFKK